MRCKGCNRDIEVRWWTPEGCDAPVLEDLCGHCKRWSGCCLRAISREEDDPPVFWPEKVALGSEYMLAPVETIPATTGIRKANKETGYGAFNRPNYDEGHGDDEDAP